jgi:hypothetical protein
MKKKNLSGVFGIFSHLESVLDAIKRLKERGYKDIRVHSPAPFPEIEKLLEKKVSPVRAFALFGGILGALSGAALTVGTALNWPLVTGGKPIISIPPFLIIVFELTILFGGITVFLGVLVNARLPRMTLEKNYRERFSEDLFGVFVPCSKREFQDVEEIFRSLSAKEVLNEEG